MFSIIYVFTQTIHYEQNETQGNFLRKVQRV